MDKSDFFRSFFGFHGRHRNPHDEADSDDLPFFGRRFNNHDSPNNVFVINLDDMMRDMEEMFHGVDDSMRNMGGLGDFPNIEGGHNFHITPNTNEPHSLRDQMLKQPDGMLPKDDQDMQGCKDCAQEAPSKRRKWPVFPVFFPQEIKDLDTEGNPSQPVQSLDMMPVVPRQNSYFKSITVQTKRTPDGKIEEHRTVRDGSGREETTVTRKCDGQSHSIMTTKEADGSEKVVENFSNVDESNKGLFESRWNAANWFNLGNKNKQPVQKQIMLPENENELDGQKTSIFQKLFGDYFSSKKS